MGKKFDGKSEKYPGVYWYDVPRPDGRGLERLYYIVYKKRGETRQHVERLGRSGQFTERTASLVRAQKQEALQPTKNEKRQQEKEERLKGNGPLTFARLWELYQEANRDKACIRTDSYNYHNHVAFYLAGKEPEKITTGDIDGIRRKVEAKGLAPQTVKHVVALVQRLMRYGQALGLLVMPPALIFNMPIVDNQKTEHMTDAQLAAFLKALDEEVDQDAAAFLRLELYTGMRRGAVMGLMWSDCDFENNRITLRGEAAKNGKTEHIPMPPTVKSILQGIARTSDYVFPGKDGGPRKHFRRIAKRVRDKAGLPKDFRYNHGLRHAYASRLASSGEVNLYEIQKLLTHSSPAMTQRYAHLADEALMRAASVAERALASKQENS